MKSCGRSEACLLTLFRTAVTLLHVSVMPLPRLLLVAGLFAATLLPAQSAPVTALRADRVIVGDGTQIPNAVVLIQGDRITAVGPAAKVRIPTGARTIDLAGQTLLPGFIDAHTHLTSIDNDGGDLAALRETPAHGAIYATVNARKTLEASEKASAISADELERAEKELDKITHDHVDLIDKALGRKEHELLEV